MRREVQVKRKKVKNITLRINFEGIVTVTAPYFVTESYINEFVKSKESWIEKKLIEIEAKKKAIEQKEKIRVNEILFLGNSYKVEVINSNHNSVELKEKCIIVNVKDSSYRDTVLEEWYKIKAKEIFLNTIIKYSSIVGEPINRLSIKKMKTRWGSCNHVKRYINLNLELIKQPIEFIEYVVLHELAHIVHPNHSREFWSYVEKYMKDYRERKTLIKF